MSVRFAPSPTGVFHIGNLRTAWISHVWARALNKPWVVRFEDIDTPRVVPGAQDQQLKDMAALGLVPDQIFTQSQRRWRHWELFTKAREEGAIYPCSCSRKEVLESLASAPHSAEMLYTGACRRGIKKSEAKEVAWRFRNDQPDGAQDFIVARTDLAASENSFQPAYHWACAIDDGDGNYDLLVRAYDLENVVPLQRRIQKWMGCENFPAVFHTSLVVGADGKRLEKRTKGVTLAELPEMPRFAFVPEGYAPGRVWGEREREFTIDAAIRGVALGHSSQK